MITRSLRKDLRELLRDEELVTERQYRKAEAQAGKLMEPVEKVLIAMGFITEKDLIEVLGREIGVDFIDLDELKIEPELWNYVPEHFAKRFKVVPVGQSENRIKLAMVDPAEKPMLLRPNQ